MKRSRRKRCVAPDCRILFRADPRVGDAQVTCGSLPCQVWRRRERQALWRARNPDYDADRRLRVRQKQEEEALESLSRRLIEGDGDSAVCFPGIPRPPSLGRGLPWRLIQDQLGTLFADVLSLVLHEISRFPEARSRSP